MLNTHNVSSNGVSARSRSCHSAVEVHNIRSVYKLTVTGQLQLASSLCTRLQCVCNINALSATAAAANVIHAGTSHEA